MSQELTNARRLLSKVSSDLKQGQFISAATAVRDGARMFGRVPMIKKESEELTNLLQTACDHLRYNKEVAKLFPLAFNYTPGQENELADLMNQLIEALQEASTEDAIRKRNEQIAADFARGRKQLEDGRLDEARATFAAFAEDYSDEAELIASVGELFMNAGQLDDAYRYLAAAVKLEPGSAHLLNRLGIVLRKMKKFEQAEAVYVKATDIEPGDPNLYFNKARVYLDQLEWSKAIADAQKALDLSPDFSEAGKLIAYARKKSEAAG